MPGLLLPAQIPLWTPHTLEIVSDLDRQVHVEGEGHLDGVRKMTVSC